MRRQSAGIGKEGPRTTEEGVPDNNKSKNASSLCQLRGDASAWTHSGLHGKRGTRNVKTDSTRAAASMQ